MSSIMSDVSTPLKSNRSTLFMAWGFWAIVSFFYAFQYILRVSPSVMAKDIMQKFSLDAIQFGEFAGVYYLGYALMHIPIGLMLDRLQLKFVIAGCIAVTVLGMLPLVFIDHWFVSVVGRFLVGAGSSGAILSVFKVTRLYFPEKWFSRLLGLSVTIGLSGAVFGSTPVDRLNQKFGWEPVLIIFFCIGILIAAIIAFAMPRRVSSSDHHDSILQDLKIVLTNQRVLITALCAALMVGPLEGFADVWAVGCLETLCGFERIEATSLPMLLYIGMGIGSPLLAAIAERYQAYYGVVIMSALGMALAFIIMLFFKPSIYIMSALFFIVGILCAYQVLAIYMNSKNCDESHSGLVTALTNMIIMAFGSVFHFIISHTMNLFWDGHMVNHLAIYDAQSYTYGIAVIPVALIIAFFGFIMLRAHAFKVNVKFK